MTDQAVDVNGGPARSRTEPSTPPETAALDATSAGPAAVSGTAAVAPDGTSGRRPATRLRPVPDPAPADGDPSATRAPKEPRPRAGDGKPDKAGAAGGERSGPRRAEARTDARVDASTPAGGRVTAAKTDAPAPVRDARTVSDRAPASAAHGARAATAAPAAGRTES
ncbi:hypothetical protein ACFWV8_32110, partial [Streptomyces sp. NPDC058665]